MVTLENVLELADQLTDEHQEMLMIFKKRIIARRRQEITSDAQKSLGDFRDGKLQSMAAQEAIALLL
jgi:hypothetical protein